MDQPTPEGIKTLPKTQELALEKLTACTLLREALGDEMVDSYIKVKHFVLDGGCLKAATFLLEFGLELFLNARALSINLALINLALVVGVLVVRV